MRYGLASKKVPGDKTNFRDTELLNHRYRPIDVTGELVIVYCLFSFPILRTAMLRSLLAWYLTPQCYYPPQVTW